MQIIFLIVCIVAFVQGKLKVIRPAELVDRLGSKIDMALANFGEIPFGHRLVGYVDMASPTDACSPLEPAQGSQFLLIERGECTFVTKVRNAQNAGYSLAIIGNNNDDPLTSDFVMADDGHGHSVSIPSIFITSRDFQILKQYSTRIGDNLDDKVFILVKFDVQKKERIDVLLNLKVNDRDSYRVIDEFSDYYNLLQKENVNYTLVYEIFSTNTTETEHFTDPDNCICSRRYCAEDPDGAGIATGKNIIQEIIRQTCIFKLYADQFFQYMDKFNFQCSKPQAYSTCGSKIITNLQISADEINKCRDDSFIDVVSNEVTKNETNAFNTILEHQLLLKQQAGWFMIPSAIVNSVVYKGRLTGKGIFGEICNSFNTPPSICKDEVENYYNQGNDYQYLIWLILIISILIAIFVIILYCLFKKFVKRDSVEVTQVQVNEMVSQYIKFYEGKDQQKQNSF
ncbi:unnamed protein product (macronuclear) [Paramecium tetraurelia]|uniref:Uncharacterized protein n=1 Tax=Paramecium tetraurelia TaxID=5888 RepID=A0BRB2_PARTE|nr:uncharacterized protein GSPATT00031310001 [Paramecium tetraurelia]CAK61079.1 unnamed protein product [Paramecium tetraurelia]|eukprot:XP_001428477.1 hypothetical protein (macronuclear) [Paramecium tetraurelia strain d4-2]